MSTRKPRIFFFSGPFWENVDLNECIESPADYVDLYVCVKSPEEYVDLNGCVESTDEYIDLSECNESPKEYVDLSEGVNLNGKTRVDLPFLNNTSGKTVVLSKPKMHPRNLLGTMYKVRCI